MTQPSEQTTPIKPPNGDFSLEERKWREGITKAVNTIPTVNDATLTIQKNGSSVGTFTANSSTDTTVNVTVPTKTSELTNNSGFITSSSIPTVNNATLTIQRNGSSVGTFTANASSNKTVNITVPTKTSELTNNSNYAQTSTTNTWSSTNTFNGGLAISNATNYMANGSSNAYINLQGDGHWIFCKTNFGSSSYISFFNDSSLQRGVRLAANATSWSTGSDRRLKTAIEDLEPALDKILELRPVRYALKADTTDNPNRVGFIAQEVQPIIPEAVDGVETDTQYLGMASTELIPFLVKAIQELQSEIDDLKARLGES